MKETWVMVPDFSIYEVSDRGRIRSIDRIVNRFNRWGVFPCKTKGCVLKHSRIGKYHCVKMMRDDGILVTRLVHQAVCEAFHGPRPAGREVLHGNDDANDNSAGNLRWGTRSENFADAKRNGRYFISTEKRRAGVGWLKRKDGRFAPKEETS